MDDMSTSTKFTPLEAAHKLGVRLDYLYGRLRNGYLGGYKIDGRWTVTAADLREYRRKYPQRRRHA